jgi:acyl carrier protein
MLTSDLNCKIRSILAENLEINPDYINDDADLVDMGINSITFIKTVITIETEFDIEFDEENLDIENFRNLKSLIEHVNRLISGSAVSQ